MSCNLTTGMNSISGCKTGVGGVNAFYITNSSNVTAITESNSLITQIDMSGTSKFYEFKPNKKSSNWMQSSLDSASGNIVPFEQTATMVFSKNQSYDINTIKLLATGYFSVIVEEKGGNYYLLNGTDNEGLELVSGTEFQSGTVVSDSNAWTIVLKAEALAPASQIIASAATAVIQYTA